ncbi:MAG: pallilysin-related adhesin [Salinispira sp.]
MAGGSIFPQAGDSIALFSPQTPNPSSPAGEDTADLFISLPDEFIVHQIHNVNIDTDNQNEQIVVFKDQNDQGNFIGIMVIDLDPVLNSYLASWQGYTQATDLKTLNLYIDDIAGNGNVEIVVIGVNKPGEQTLDIFQQNSAANFGLQFASIISIRADIAVDIHNANRENIPATGLNTLAHTIHALNHDLGTENNLDMIQSTYTWQPDDSRYHLTSTRKISGTIVEQDQLARLHAGNVNDFHVFLDGLWIHTDGDQIILFSHDNETIQMATADRQLHFYWTSSARWGIGNNLWIYAQNEIISNITQRIQLSVLDLNTIAVEFNTRSNSTFWSGSYQRVENNSTLQNTQYHIKQKILYPYEISGLYVSDSDWEMFFAAPYITLRTREQELNGAYAVFQLNDQSILEIKFFDNNDALVEKRNYLIHFEQETEGTQLQRRIHMQEAILTSYGAEVLHTNDTVIMEQIIQLENDQ